MKCAVAAGCNVGMLVFAGVALGQSPAFEVATIKPFTTQPQPTGRGGVFFAGKRGGPGTADPGQITWPGASPKSLILTAYDVKDYQVTGPAWIETTRYDIVAKVPSGATAEQVNLMWQSFLADRFGLMLHHSPKEFQVEELVVAKGGHKLKETDLAPDAPPSPPPAGPLQLDQGGAPVLTGPALINFMTGSPSGVSAHLVGKAQSLAQVANALGNQLKRPVLDKTGLTGRYDFSVAFTPENARTQAGAEGAAPGDGASEPGSNLASAVLEQLGLRLAKNKAMLDVLVVDRIEKPSDN